MDKIIDGLTTLPFLNVVSGLFMIKVYIGDALAFIALDSAESITAMMVGVSILALNAVKLYKEVKNWNKKQENE